MLLVLCCKALQFCITCNARVYAHLPPEGLLIPHSGHITGVLIALETGRICDHAGVYFTCFIRWCPLSLKN
jgi:hypothetical protein